MNFCKDCKHIKVNFFDAEHQAFCKEHKEINPITGREELQRCAVIRVSDFPCLSFEGHLFKEKTPFRISQKIVIWVIATIAVIGSFFVLVHTPVQFSHAHGHLYSLVLVILTIIMMKGKKR